MRSIAGRVSRGWVAGVGLAMVLVVGGCKTQDDAAAAATQMAATAQTLSAYYASLDQVLGKTQDAYQAQSALLGVPPMDLSETRAQIQVRADLATEVGKLASLFQKLSGSTAASDSSTAAGSLNTELVSVTGLASNDAEAKAVTVGVQEIVALIQQHDEIQAAKKVAPLCHNLAVFFDSEKKAYDSLNQAYLVTAKSVAQQMVKMNQVDTSGVFLSALQPFNLTPAVSKEETKKGMQDYLLAQIDANYKLKLDASQKASEALSEALHEMDARVDLVAHDKTMSFKIPPLSLDTAKAWIAQVSK